MDHEKAAKMQQATLLSRDEQRRRSVEIKARHSHIMRNSPPWMNTRDRGQREHTTQLVVLTSDESPVGGGFGMVGAL